MITMHVLVLESKSADFRVKVQVLVLESKSVGKGGGDSKDS